ncbi:hypothetical protein CLOP_g3404, partial [Closterium sp. NIES-67]
AGMLPGRIIYMTVLEAVKANTLKGINGVTELPLEGHLEGASSSSSSSSNGSSKSSGASSSSSSSSNDSSTSSDGSSSSGTGGTGRWLHLSDTAAAGLASAVGGMCASLATQAVVVPVDVISSRLVAQQGDLPSNHATRQAAPPPLRAAAAAAPPPPPPPAAAAAAAGAVRYTGGLHALVTILKTEGPRGLYRGFGLSVMTYAPSGFIWWGTYGAAQRFFWSTYDRYVHAAGSTTAPPLGLVVGVQVAGGVCAGLASALATTPLDTVKTRIQVGRKTGSEASVSAVVRQLVAQDGMRGLYRGFAPRCASTMLWGTAMVSTYEYLKRLCAKDISTGSYVSREQGEHT